MTVNIDQPLPNIRMRMPSLTKTEQSIVESFLLPHFLHKTTSIKEVAERLKVSPALLVKVSKKLGYSGFKQLKDALTTQLESSDFTPAEQLLPNDSCEEIISKVLHNSISALTEILDFIDGPLVNAAAELLLEAKDIEFYAAGASSIVCEDFQQKLLRIGIKASVPMERHLMLMSASLLTDHDVVLVVSHSGQTSDLMDAVRVAKQSGAKIISITNNYNAELSQLSDIPIYAPSSPEPVMGKNGTARLVKLAIIDCLYATIASKMPELAEENLNKTHKSLGLWNQ